MWDYFLCSKRYGSWPSNKPCCNKRLNICRKDIKSTTAKVNLGKDYTSSPLTIGDRWLTWPKRGTPPTIPSTIFTSSTTTQSPYNHRPILSIPSLNGTITLILESAFLFHNIRNGINKIKSL